MLVFLGKRLKRKFFEIEIVRIDGEIVLQKSAVSLFQPGQFLRAVSQVPGGLTTCILELPDIFRHQRAIGIVMKFAMLRIIGKRIKLATEWLGLAQRAACGAKMRAVSLDAYTTERLGLLFGQRDLEGRIALLDEAASSTFGAVIKRHARPCVSDRLLAA